MESRCLCRVVKPGFHFVPTPTELILSYLKPKIERMPLPCIHLIKESDVYGKHCTPSQIFRGDDPYWIASESSNKKTLYVFTKLSKKGSRADRTAGLGTWTNQNTKDVKNDDGQVIGFKTAFTYTRKMNTSNVVDDQHEKWCMYEYSIDKAFLRRPNDENYVICAISRRSCNNNNEEADLRLTAPYAAGNEVVPLPYDLDTHYNYQPWGIYDNHNILPTAILNQGDFYHYLQDDAALNTRGPVYETSYSSTRGPNNQPSAVNINYQPSVSNLDTDTIRLN